MSIINILGAVPMAVAMAFIWPLSAKFGKRIVVLIGCIVAVAGGVIAGIFPDNFYSVAVGVALKSLGSSPACYMILALIADVLDHFLYYAEMLEKTLGEKIAVDQDFNIMFERGGENRSDRHLSDGQRSLCALPPPAPPQATAYEPRKDSCTDFRFLRCMTDNVSYAIKTVRHGLSFCYIHFRESNFL